MLEILLNYVIRLFNVPKMYVKNMQDRKTKIVLETRLYMVSAVE